MMGTDVGEVGGGSGRGLFAHGEAAKGRGRAL